MSLATLITTTTTTTKPQRLVIKLIHSHSIRSPHHNQHATISDIAEQTMKSSAARFTYLQTKLQRNSAIDEAHEAAVNVVADNVRLQFLAELYLGDPRRRPDYSPQLVSIDTAGNLLWIQCLPCAACFNQSALFFDPSKSSTFTNLSCNSRLCFSTGGQCRSHQDPCPYSVSYNDGIASTGTLAQDYFYFTTFIDDDNATTSKIPLVFGCGHENVGSTDGQQSGILGLAPGNVSLVSQMGSKFSHCFGNISDPNYSHNRLVLGDGTRFLGSSTLLDPSNDLYYVTLEGISVGEKRLIIDPFSFKRTPSGTGGAILDSATTLTWLATGAFYPLRNEVKRQFLGKSSVSNSSSSSQLCYKGTMGRDLDEFPAVKFHFANGTDMVLDKWSMFHQTKPDEFCMAVVETRVEGFSIIGLMAQQYHNVAYDIIGQKVYFEKIDCEHLY